MKALAIFIVADRLKAAGGLRGGTELSNRDHDEAVRERAYLLWEKAGCPSGREHEFWAQASREIEGEEQGLADTASKEG